MTTPYLYNGNNVLFQEIVQFMGQFSMAMQISGEQGLGKEEVVRLLYAHSRFRNTPFIKVNCPLLASDPDTDPPGTLSEPDATVPGSLHLFRLYRRGVLYLHRVDCLGKTLQQRLLEMIMRQHATDRPSPVAADQGMLLLSTALRPLEELVSEGRFLPDLGNLLCGLAIHIPPLRHSPERIEPLVSHFLRQARGKMGALAAAGPLGDHLAALKAHRWPGNIKELGAVVQRAFRANDWDAAIRTLGHDTTAGQVHLCPEKMALMPDFEITQSRMLDQLAETIPAEEMGLMDLVLYEEALTNKKRH